MDMPPNAVLAAANSSQMMCDAAPAAAIKVARAEVEFMLFACTSASFLHGKGWDVQVAKSIEDASGIPATTTATAVADALEFLGAKTIFMVTPYSPEVNAREIAFLGYRGVEVRQQFSFGCTHSRDVALVSPETIHKALVSRRNEIRACDALFVSCTMLRSMEIAERLEHDIGAPVVTSNTASVWAMLRAISEDTSTVPAGQLFHTVNSTDKPSVDKAGSSQQ